MDLARLRRRIENEMALAQQAHSAGREGRARVCARRAAGLAAAHHLEGRGQSPRASSAYDALRRVAQTDGLPPELRRAAGRLTVRVTEDFVLPHREDPLADARAVIEACLASAENR